jgi:hypothetical protein
MSRPLATDGKSRTNHRRIPVVSVETDPVTDPDDADIARKTSDGQKADDVHDGEPDVDSETAELDDTGGGEGEADAKGTGIDHAEAEQDAA